ncbi:LOW QUALITY PROTEIN: HIPL1 protein-like [Dioscorea cayenensis subsp. rotundata]|uniref:LOW QUALITY PROTEIN: HIPL1 protein-like n=1 Tax=Dioscorea cayennensis subsp. rotundata TaxID=55577 RepID=A0AB40BVN2_DIOCR|nr:LOW QUALITY PROTEIN: HIPL1 protein-like [Dioscorea cayenensis subsp. rotundata]
METTFMVSFLLLLFLPITSFAFPLCTNSIAPVTLKAPLAFCSYNGSSCCDATDDANLQKKFQSMNISDSACGSLVKSILCTKCNPFSAELFGVESNIRTVPLLCNSTASVSSTQSKDAASNFCAQVWDTCKGISIRNSPFAPSLQGSTGVPVSSSKLIDLWQSNSDFCQSFGGSSDDTSVCFDGNSVSFNTTPNSPPKGVCLERIHNGSYISMSAHPDGSNRIFLSNQAGMIWLATVPEEGSGKTLEFDELNPFVDLTDEIHFDTQFGLMGMAFHPNFTTNGRFFVSFNCDRTQSTSCSGRCACNSDVGCDPSNLAPDNGAQPCQYQTVIAEFSANSSSSTPSTATTASPLEVRRILTMGLPFTSHHGGQILFGPKDGYLYFMMGDGGGKGDPLNFSQNKKSLLGKILRLDINNIPTSQEIADLRLWGNYSIPEDNPFSDDSEAQAEIWAYGLRNPWRCSFDSGRPFYFYCADTGEDTYEEIDLISKGGNYGWPVYEGPNRFQPIQTSQVNTTIANSTNITNPIFPVMGYTHAMVNKDIGSASVIGGYAYRSMEDPCMYGRYLYADLYAGAMWAGTESPESSGNYTSTLLPFSCAKDSLIPCDSVAGSSLPSLGYIFSFGEDNRKDVFILTSKGVYRVVRPSRCNYACAKEKNTNDVVPAPGPSSDAQFDRSGRMSMFLSAIFLFAVGFGFTV